MPRGNRCPSCGQLTFHQKKGVYTCSNQDCGAVGWLNQPPSPGGGKGSNCNLCGANTVRRIHKTQAYSIWHCYNCKATYVI